TRPVSCRHGQCLPNSGNATAKQLNSHLRNPQQVVEPPSSRIGNVIGTNLRHTEDDHPSQDRHGDCG
ncbi:hypothetical protein, partial [Escherichia coli]|uniref:hypothetical protein n=1 Tax=Escherichia coli TaxID=562 RepID=UPI0019538980